jgi:hypothetical protein
MASARNGGLEQLLERGPTAPSGVSKREKGAERVSRDLDAIVLKALSRNAAARYESAKELREDLDRYLAQRPVAARPRAVLPRVGKFVVRRRWQCVAAVVVAISAAGFVVLQRYQVRRTSQRNLETVKSVRALFTSFNDRVAQLPESTETRRAIIMELVSRLEGLDELAGSDPDLLYEVALCYYDVGRVWSSAAVETLFDTSRAYDSFERARLFAQRAAQISGKERDRLLIAKVLIGRTLAALTDYNFEDVIRFSQEAESFIRLNQQSLLRIEKREITDGRLSQLMVYRSMALVAQDRPNEALEARDGANRLLGGEWRLSVADRYTAVLLNGTAASHLCYSGMTVDGMEQARRAASISAEFMRSQKRASIEDASDWTSIVMVQCEIQSNRGREALALLRPLIEVALRAHQRDPGQKHALLALVDRYELAGEAFLVLGQASRAEDIERKGMSLLLSLDESVRDSRAELMRAQVEFGLGRATRVQATESNMQGAAARALLKSSCEHYARAERQFTGFLNQHGGIPIASRRMMERTAEELRTFCSIAN